MCHLCEERSYDGFRTPIQHAPEAVEKPAATEAKPTGIRLPAENGNDNVAAAGKGPSR